MLWRRRCVRMCWLALLVGCHTPETAAPAPDLAVALAPDLARPAAGGDGGGGADCGLDSGVNLLDLVDSIVTKMRAGGNSGSDALVVPSAADRDAFAARVVAILAGDEQQACALPASYRLVRL